MLYDWFLVPYDGVIARTLADRFHVTTVPAIVLLDASGRVVCKDGRDHIRTDRLGHDFPWRRRRPTLQPMVDFDLPRDSRRSALPPPPLGAIRGVLQEQDEYQVPSTVHEMISGKRGETN